MNIPTVSLWSRWMFAFVAVAVWVSLSAPVIGGEGEEEVIKRGAAIGESPKIELRAVLKEPDKYLDKPVVIEGTIAEVCQKKGCWMEVQCGGADSTVRVTFLDYGFFVPKDSHGMLVRAEGRFHAKVWSKEDADHLEGEGAHLVRQPDGTATEVGFVASGVELRQPKVPPKRAAEASKP